MSKDVTLRQAQQFAQALYMVEFQEYKPLNFFTPLEMGSKFGCITDILFKVPFGVQYYWRQGARHLEIKD